jgi:membrane protein YqaA with SNARE-associated domain
MNLLWSAIASGFGTSLIPIGLAEAAAFGFGAVRPPADAVILLAAFTVAHVSGKLVWYWLGTAADRLPIKSERILGYIAKSRAMLARHPAYGAGILGAAAVASIPPFHLASIAAGIAKVPLWQFVSISLVGRAIRFGLIGAVPGVARMILGDA